jgi:hypothetical protein
MQDKVKDLNVFIKFIDVIVQLLVEQIKELGEDVDSNLLMESNTGTNSCTS